MGQRKRQIQGENGKTGGQKPLPLSVRKLGIEDASYKTWFLDTKVSLPPPLEDHTSFSFARKTTGLVGKHLTLFMNDQSAVQ